MRPRAEARRRDHPRQPPLFRKGLAAAVERWFSKHAHAFGLRPEFPFHRLEAWAASHGGMEVVERRRVALFGVYTLVRFRKRTAADAAPQVFAATG